MRNRKPKTAFAAIFALSLALAAGLRCGKEKDDKDDVGKKPTPGLPTEWDGKDDWSGSVFKAVDE